MHCTRTRAKHDRLQRRHARRAVHLPQRHRSIKCLGQGRVHILGAAAHVHVLALLRHGRPKFRGVSVPKYVSVPNLLTDVGAMETLSLLPPDLPHHGVLDKPLKEFAGEGVGAAADAAAEADTPFDFHSLVDLSHPLDLGEVVDAIEVVLKHPRATSLPTMQIVKDILA
jgi:hypothetical protein